MWLDYYLIRPGTLLVEEFVLAEDGSASRLDSVAWSREDGSWTSSASLSRDLRLDPDLRSRVTPVSRREAEAAYHRLGGGDLLGEEALRAHFHDGLPLAVAPPLRLRPPQVEDGFQETRMYRILFANELSAEVLGSLRALWSMSAAAPASLRIGDDAFVWDLRRIGAGVAWCLDLTANLAGTGGDAVHRLLRYLASTVREYGVIPVTIERFA